MLCGLIQALVYITLSVCQMSVTGTELKSPKIMRMYRSIIEKIYNAACFHDHSEKSICLNDLF